jgi:cyanocobalamin reductase (cyanide-eliminating) / alkylcobalamin dealkylase
MREALAAAGFDIVQPFDGALLDGERRAGLLVGNTRALWPVFLANKPAGPDPLDHHVEQVITPLVPATGRVFFAHRQYDGRFLPFQQLAVAAGLGALSETHLVIHPEYGPWFALRAAIVVEGESPAPVQIPRPCRCEAPCREALARAVGSGDWRAWLAVRDACPVGREHRYSEDQLAFHYIHGLLRTPAG